MKDYKTKKEEGEPFLSKEERMTLKEAIEKLNEVTREYRIRRIKKIVKLIIAGIAGISGYTMLWHFTSWQIALSIFLIHLSINLENSKP